MKLLKSLVFGLLFVSTAYAQQPSQQPTLSQIDPEAPAVTKLMTDMLAPGCKSNPMGFCPMLWKSLGRSPGGGLLYTVLLPTGPCGSITRLSPKGITLSTGDEYDNTLWLMPNWDKATRALWGVCTRKKADIDAAHGH